MRAVDHNSNSLEAWKEQLWSTYVQLESKSDAPNFYGDVLEYFRGVDSLSLVNSTSQLTERTSHNIRADGQEVLLIAFQIEGRGAVYQDERVAETGPGKLVFYDSTKPYRLGFDGPFRQMVLRVSHATLRSRSHALSGLNARTFQALDGSAGVALDFLKSISHRANEIEVLVISKPWSQSRETLSSMASCRSQTTWHRAIVFSKSCAMEYPEKSEILISGFRSSRFMRGCLTDLCAGSARRTARRPVR
ncbi:cupin domain-containing protein [Rhizobium nepotum]|uniref:cupin domain-containing protein n=1 Tax=Rhizobium nepotum TaxID=1035271 RepID=UPI003CE863C4